MKNNRWFTKFRWLPLIALFGCAGVQKSCAAGCASSFGADWIVVQYNNNSDVMKHWCLKNTSVDNEGHSDGIWWQDTQGHLVHLSGGIIAFRFPMVNLVVQHNHLDFL